MGLKFKCPNCNENIYLKYLTVGDIAECRNCRQRNVVPETAASIPNDEIDPYQQAPETRTIAAEIPPTQSTHPVSDDKSSEMTQTPKLEVKWSEVVVAGKKYRLASRRRRWLAVLVNDLLSPFYAGVFVSRALLESILRRQIPNIVAGSIGVAFIFIAATLDQTGIINLSFAKGVSSFFATMCLLALFFGGGIGIVILFVLTITNFFPSFFIALCLFGWFFGGDGALKGQGWSKRTFKIRVIHSRTGEPCTFWQSFLRRLLIYLPLIGMIDVFFALDKKKQRLGDKLAKTIVVNQEKDEIVGRDRPASKTITIFLLLLVLTYGSSLIQGQINPTSFFPTQNESLPKFVKSTDGRYQVTVPDNWIELPELHDEASIMVGSRWNELYLIVHVEKKDDLDDINLEDYSQLTRGFIISTLESEEPSQLLEVSGPIELSILGNKAIQYEIRGTLEGLGIVYLHSSAENSQNFFQIIGYTSISNFSNENKVILQEAIQSLQSIP